MRQLSEKKDALKVILMYKVLYFILFIDVSK